MLICGPVVRGRVVVAISDIASILVWLVAGWVEWNGIDGGGFFVGSGRIDR
jgi:hypothetical protein